MSVKHSLLALLSTQPMYGQQLKEEFEARTGELWPLNVGQVYTSLARLVRDGLVEPASDSADSDDSTRPYSITPQGEIELDLWLKAAPRAATPPRDDIVMKVMIALSIDPDHHLDVVQSHRRQLIESMRSYTRLKADDDVSTPTLLMCDAELFRLEAAVRWLDAVEARVRSGARFTSSPTSPQLPSSRPSDADQTDRMEVQS